MTCHSCVAIIEENIGKRPGVYHVQVSLAEKKGWVIYDPQKWTSEQLAEMIDDMGFDATSVSTKDTIFEPDKDDETSSSASTNIADSDEKRQLKKCALSVEKMASATCAASIEKSISELKGVQSINVAVMFSKADVVYDSALISADEIRDSIRDLGYPSQILDDTENGYSKIDLLISGMTCASCVSRIENHVSTLRGVVSCSVALTTSSAIVEFSPEMVGPRDIIEWIQSLGFSTELASRENRLKKLGHAEEISKWRTSFLISLFFGIPTLGVMIYFHWIVQAPMHPEKQVHIFTRGLSLDNLILFVLATPVQIFGGRYFYVRSWKAIRHGSANMDVLIVLATSIAYIYSVVIILVAIILHWSYSPMTFFDVPPMLMVFISLGRWMEYKAKGQTSEALTKLMSLQAKVALLITKDKEGNIISERRIEIELVQRGDLIKVLPGENIAVDGVVVEGSSSANESFITGENMPVVKIPGNHVIGGSVNQTGLLIIEATRVGQDSTLSQIVRLVEEAQTSKVVESFI
uniref:P-type Cu(+) transporter n=1 Tax=Acrobeloides nanus TaxID=290746 RepID=A0A914DZB3_9BILA